MALAPTNITQAPSITDSSGAWGKVTWTDPNAPAGTPRLWRSATGLDEKAFAHAGSSAWLPAGTYWLSIKTPDGQGSPRAQFTVASAPGYPTERECLERLVGPVDDGAQVELHPAPAAAVYVVDGDSVSRVS
jgi:hypothetical protein